MIASGNSWNPRPVFQSFFAYTPKLVELNRNHLLSDRAPDNIIFRLETIDGRIPSAEDGASWPVILENYQPTMMDNKFLFFKRKHGVKDPEPTIIGTGSHHFGDIVDVPNTDKLVFAEIAIRPSVLGMLANTFFKSDHLQIDINLKNGAQKQYRIIAGMVQSGFVISPLIENTLELALLYNDSGDLNDKLVNSFSIAPVDDDSRLWRSEYTVTFKQFGFPPPFDLSNVIKFDGRVNDILSGQTSIATECAGNIDSVNGVNLASVSTKILPSSILRVSGWLATSVEKPTKTDAIFLVLSSEEGESVFFQTQPTLRPDVSAHFMKPELTDSGYESTVDVSEYEGNYTLGIAFRQAGYFKICPQYHVPISFYAASPKNIESTNN